MRAEFLKKKNYFEKSVNIVTCNLGIWAQNQN